MARGIDRGFKKPTDPEPFGSGFQVSSPQMYAPPPSGSSKRPSTPIASQPPAADTLSAAKEMLYEDVEQGLHQQFGLTGASSSPTGDEQD